MRGAYEDRREQLSAAILESSGDSESNLRRYIEAYSEQSALIASVPADQIPPDLLPYITKVARNAYKVTDEDIEFLKSQGYSEDALFEITLSAALGAGMVRLDSGLAALKGALYATEKH
jgi:hypothetical protein